MAGANPTLDFLTAWLGYLSVAVTMVARYSGNERASRWLTPTMFVIVTGHVGLV